MTSLHRPTTPLRQRMIEDMKLRDLSPNAILAYVDRVAASAKHFGKSPQLLGPKEVRGGFAGLSLGFGFPADWRATKASRPRRRGAEQAASRGQAGGFAGSSLVFGFPANWRPARDSRRQASWRRAGTIDVPIGVCPFPSVFSAISVVKSLFRLLVPSTVDLAATVSALPWTTEGMGAH
jgi:hypothetical protein